MAAMICARSGCRRLFSAPKTIKAAQVHETIVVKPDIRQTKTETESRASQTNNAKNFLIFSIRISFGLVVLLKTRSPGMEIRSQIAIIFDKKQGNVSLIGRLLLNWGLAPGKTALSEGDQRCWCEFGR